MSHLSITKSFSKDEDATEQRLVLNSVLMPQKGVLQLQDIFLNTFLFRHLEKKNVKQSLLETTKARAKRTQRISFG